MIEEIWKTTNVSTLLLLKLFDDICEECYSRVDSTIEYPFYMLCFEYGLLQAYLEEDVTSSFLRLVFDNEVVHSDLEKITNSPYYSFVDRLIDSKHYKSIQNYSDDKLIVVKLKIPDIYRDDIIIIKSSQYSKVSREFKSKMRLHVKNIPLTNHKKVFYIMQKQLAARIVYKSNLLKEALEEELNMNDISTNKDYYIQWRNAREIWNEEKFIKKYSFNVANINLE